MPKGIYPRTEKHLNKGNFIKGHPAHNLGKESENKLKKVELFKLGKLIECRIHGFHLRWRLHTGNNVQCKDCCLIWQMNQRRKNPLRFLYRDAKKHAKSHNREFNISLDDLVKVNELQNNKCSLTGVLFDLNNPPSLDRIDSDVGYNLDNIQLILIQVNRMKSNFTQQEFIDMCYKIVAYSEAGEKKSKSKGKKK